MNSSKFQARDGDTVARLLELGVILAVPALRDSAGSSDDFAKLNQILRTGVRLSDIWDTAAALIQDPNYQSRKQAIEGKLLVQRKLTADDVASLVSE